MFSKLPVCLLMACAVAAIAGGCAGRAAGTPDSILVRNGILRDGESVGIVERSLREFAAGREITTRQTMRIDVDGLPSQTVIEETTRIEDWQGKTVSIRHRSSVGRDEWEASARITGDRAIISRHAQGDTRETTLLLPEDLRFDNGDGLLGTWDETQDSQLEFSALDVRAPLIERIVYFALPADTTNGGRALRRLSFADGSLRSLTTLHFDSTGALLGTDQPMFGSDVETTAGRTAMAGINASANPVRDSMLRSPYRISRDAMQGHIRYTFGFDAGVEFAPPQTSEQRVRPTPDGFILDICADCGPGLEASESALTAALGPTFWLQSDHRLLTRIGERVGASDASDADKMVRLGFWARERLSRIDFAGHFSAVEALARGAGDCTESAVVLAALGRAAGIPTRVASGIVYSREQYHGISHVFTSHVWTLAFVDGKWKSFDIALDGFDATHIALTISDGDPGSIQAGHQLAALLRWDAMTQVVQGAANPLP